MNYLNFSALMAVTYLTVFLTSWPSGLWSLLGAQIDLLPALIVYCGLNLGWGAMSSVAVLGGLWFDSLSANPLGISILPLFLVGTLVLQNHDLILRDERYAQFLLGAVASVLAPILTLLLLLSIGYKPIFGWGSIWHWTLMGLVGGAVTPFYFLLFRKMERVFAYGRLPESSFRRDREIKRGRI
jgi:rod shape-determining protein MreD